MADELAREERLRKVRIAKAKFAAAREAKERAAVEELAESSEDERTLACRRRSGCQTHEAVARAEPPPKVRESYTILDCSEYPFS